mmetsp:Transcript_41860/g.53927  ORF Transcript_41860/g.53927 Transcript_41860/m.53927 type:complete len:466 (+) Transcript_41860:126-1523(+)
MFNIISRKTIFSKRFVANQPLFISSTIQNSFSSQQINIENDDPYSIPDVKTNIKAFYVGRSINIAKAHRDFCTEQPHRFKRDFIMISFPPPPTPPPRSSSSSRSIKASLDQINEIRKSPSSLLQNANSISQDEPFKPIKDTLYVNSSKHEKYTQSNQEKYDIKTKKTVSASDVFGTAGNYSAELDGYISTSPTSSSSPSYSTSTSSSSTSTSTLLSSSSVHPPKFGNKHIAIFNYGSVVFFNFKESEVHQKLSEIRAYTSDTIPREFQIKEDYTIVERSYLTESCVLRNDLTILRELDFHSATVISTVMAQTVALDHFSMLVDQMLEIFTEFNMSVEKTGQFMAIKRNDLFKLVAQNNAVLIAVLSKLSLLERSDIAWKMPAYVHIWEGLREEFEIDDRFNNLKYKLNLIQDNTKFFLEIMHNQKSNMLEWIIIVLISAECVLMVMDICDITPTKIIDNVTTIIP